jgi:hypothetical protein
MTMEKLTDDYGLKMGEIEQFMDVSKGFIDTVDLDNGIYEANALSQLEAWEAKSQNLLLSSPPPGMSAQAQLAAGTPAPGVQVRIAPDDGYSDLFSKDNDDKTAQRR